MLRLPSTLRLAPIFALAPVVQTCQQTRQTALQLAVQTRPIPTEHSSHQRLCVMMTLSTSRVPSRSTDRTIPRVGLNRHIRHFLQTVVAAFILFSVQASFAKPYLASQADSGIAGWGIAHSSATTQSKVQLFEELPESLRIAMAAQQTIQPVLAEPAFAETALAEPEFVENRSCGRFGAITSACKTRSLLSMHDRLVPVAIQRY